MAGVQSLCFEEGCVLEGAHFINDTTQVRHIWGFGGELCFDKTGKLTHHRPGNLLSYAHYPHYAAKIEPVEDTTQLSCCVNIYDYMLILVNGQISYPLLTKFMLSEVLIEYLENTLHFIDGLGVVKDGKLEEFKQFLDAIQTILDGGFDAALPYHELIAQHEDFKHLMDEDIQVCFAQHKTRVVELSDNMAELPINDYWDDLIRLNEDYQ